MNEPLKSAIEKVLHEYSSARLQPLKGHALARFVRRDLPALVASSLERRQAEIEYLCCGPKFPGSWARVPWLSILNPRITRTPRKGLYVVIVFAEDGHAALLTVGQGAAFSSASQLAANRLGLLAAVAPFRGFEVGPVPHGMLGTSASAMSYSTGAVCFKVYSRETVPPDSVILEDIAQGLSYVDALAKSPIFQTMRFGRAGIQ